MLVSVVIPTRNRRDLLQETLASIVAQTHGDWEAIVVDDGSSDGTAEMVLALSENEKRIRLVRRVGSRFGAPAARNQGVTAARGDYVIFLDSDDLLAPTCLEKRLEIMESSTSLDFAAFLTQVFQSTPGDHFHLWNKFTEEDDLDRILRRDPPWQTSGPLWRKTSLTKIGSWNEKALSAQDWEFHLRALADSLTYRKVPLVDSFWRMTRPDSVSYHWKEKRRICNRVNLLKKITALLHAKNLLTSRRRRIIAAEYYEHAFVFNPNMRLAHKIWRRARKEKIIGRIEFAVVLLSDLYLRISRRANDFVVAAMIPEVRCKRDFFGALPPEAKTSRLKRDPSR